MAGSFLDPVLGWILIFHPALSILLISLIVSLVVTLAIKFFTNQSLMKDLREELKELQKEMRDLKNNPGKMEKINERFMETNMKYMSHSMRPTLFTFIPILLVFGWLSSHIAYYPLTPDTNFEIAIYFDESTQGDVTINVPQEGLDINKEGTFIPDSDTKPIINGEASWVLNGAKGEYDVTFHFRNATYSKDILITEEREYAPVEKDLRKRSLFFSSKDENGALKIVVGNKKILPFKDVPILQDIPWVNTWGWLGAYFLFSLIFSMSLRRIFKIY